MMFHMAGSKILTSDMMPTYAEYVKEAAGRNGCKAQLLPDVVGKAIVDLVRRKYSSRPASTLWEQIGISASFQNDRAWNRACEFVGDQSTLLFFEPKEDSKVFKFEDGNSLARVIEDCPLFVFYLTDETGSYLLCVNDHDYLIGAGDAMAWVSSLDMPNDEDLC